MSISSELLQQRWAMLTNPHAGPAKSMTMTRLSEVEVMEHSMMMDLVCAQFGLEHLTDEEIDQARTRFISFCQAQHTNKNRN